MRAVAGDAVTYLEHFLNGFGANQKRVPEEVNEVELNDLLGRIAWLRQQNLPEKQWAALSTLREKIVTAAHIVRMYGIPPNDYQNGVWIKIRACRNDASRIYENTLGQHQ